MRPAHRQSCSRASVAVAVKSAKGSNLRRNQCDHTAPSKSHSQEAAECQVEAMRAPLDLGQDLAVVL